MNRWAPILAGTALLATAGASVRAQEPAGGARSGVRATVTTLDDKKADLILAKREKGNLFFKPPNVPEGVLASIPAGAIREIEFPIDIDAFQATRLQRNRQWLEAAGLLLRDVLPAIPYLDIAPNNAAEPAMDACLLMMRAARNFMAQGAGEKARGLYERAGEMLSALSRISWYDRSYEAGLASVSCLIETGRLNEAEERLDDLGEPDAEDPDSGLYWLTRARLSLGLKETHRALDAATRSIVFESKDIGTFPDALLVAGRCYEELLKAHRARDVYFEAARLFMGTQWGDLARDRLEEVMASGLTADKEDPNIAKVFFEREEDMDARVRQFLERTRSQPEPEPTAEPTTEPEATP